MSLNPFARSHIEDYLHGEEPWAVVTGSTDGIGKACVFSSPLLSISSTHYLKLPFRTATVLLSKGFNVLLHGRNPTKLSATLESLKSLHPDRGLASVIADISNTIPESISAIPNYITSNNLRVTLFINNAAFVDVELRAFSDTPADLVDTMLNTGVVFFTKLCHKMIPLMREERVGGKAMMVNMGSMAAEYTMPFVTVYTGAKGFMLVSFVLFFEFLSVASMMQGAIVMIFPVIHTCPRR
jgi:17beta-estradiol 17-dehydrogenase / very-long-chain 3-oxoacyl-CoA reductase